MRRRFFCERLIELAARDLGIDSAEMRRRNLIGAGRDAVPAARLEPGRPAAIPNATAATTARRSNAASPSSAGKRKRALQGRLIDGRYHGVAVACFIEGAGAGPKETARLTSKPDGTVSVYVGSAAVGQGLETVIAQIAADTLDLPLGQVRVSWLHPHTWQRGTALSLRARRCSAARRCSRPPRPCSTRSVPPPPRSLAPPPTEIELVDGSPTRGMGAPLPSPTWQGRFSGRHGFLQQQPADLFVWIGGGACRGRPGDRPSRVAGLLVVEDVGRIVNPLTLHGQAIGGVVQGLGGAFLENLVYDANGQLLAGNLSDYLIPTAPDFPRIRAIALENHPSPSNPLGVKGAGEGAIIPVGALMANAVANALASFGAMPNQLPLSPARVWRMGPAGQTLEDAE